MTTPTWTAQVLQSTQSADLQLRIQVQYSNGTSSVVKDYHFDGSTNLSQALQAQIDSQLDALNAIANYVPPTGIVPRSTPPVTTPPDPVAVDLTQKIAHLKAAKRAVDLGVITTVAAEYVAALNAVTAEYQAKYLDLF
jgi:hypothetical protein